MKCVGWMLCSTHVSVWYAFVTQKCALRILCRNESACPEAQAVMQDHFQHDAADDGSHTLIIADDIAAPEVMLGTVVFSSLPIAIRFLSPTFSSTPPD